MQRLGRASERISAIVVDHTLLILRTFIERAIVRCKGEGDGTQVISCSEFSFDK